MESATSAMQQMFRVLVMLVLSSRSWVSSHDPCDSSPCQNGGRCGSEFTPMPIYSNLTGPGHCCMCPSGFSGEDCSYADPGKPVICFTCDSLTNLTDIAFHLEAPTCMCGPDALHSETNSCTAVSTAADDGESGSSSKSKACFPGSAQVQLMQYRSGTGHPRRDAAAQDMRRVNIGDMVLTLDPSDLQYKMSPVFMFGHRSPGLQTTYRRLRTHGGATLTASARHLVWKRRREDLDATDDMDLVAMRDVSVGDLMLVTPTATSDAANTTAAAHWEPVVGAEWVNEEGLYNPHTATGNIVVDGVSASCYIDIVLPAPLAHILLWLPKQVYYLVPLQWSRYQQDYIWDPLINPVINALDALSDKE